MPMYRNKPKVIEAVQWFIDQPHEEVFQNPDPELTCWIHIDKKGNLQALASHQGWINNNENGDVVNAGDWIIKDSNGEFYTCRRNIFGQEYEKIE